MAAIDRESFVGKILSLMYVFPTKILWGSKRKSIKNNITNRIFPTHFITHE